MIHDRLMGFGGWRHMIALAPEGTDGGGDSGWSDEGAHDAMDDDAFSFFKGMVGEEEAAAHTGREATAEPKGARSSTEGEPEEEADDGTTPFEKPADADGRPEGDAKAGEAKAALTLSDDTAEVDLGTPEAPLKATVAELKAAFTAKAATAAAEAAVQADRAALDTIRQRANTALGGAVEAAKADWARYSQIDWLAFQSEPGVTREMFLALRGEAQAALDKVHSTQSALDGSEKAYQADVQARKNTEAAATVKALTDPKTGIKGWGQPLYNELMAFAEANGAPKGFAQGLTAEFPLRMLHDAMQFRKGVAATTVQREKVVNKPTRVLNTGTKPENTGTERFKAALAAQRRSGSDDDTENAFMALMRGDD